MLYFILFWRNLCENICKKFNNPLFSGTGPLIFPPEDGLHFHETQDCCFFVNKTEDTGKNFKKLVTSLAGREGILQGVMEIISILRRLDNPPMGKWFGCLSCIYKT
jgi:hypothetical protein